MTDNQIDEMVQTWEREYIMGHITLDELETKVEILRKHLEEKYE